MTKPIIPKKRLITEKGNLIEMVAWKVPKSKEYPEGVKYAFTFVHNQQRTIAIDNYNNEGHHWHEGKKKKTYRFKSLESTADWFFRLIETFERTGDKK